MKKTLVLICLGIFTLMYCRPRITVPVMATNKEDFSILSDRIETNYRYVNANDLHFVYKEDYHDLDGFLEYKIYSKNRQIVQSNTTQSQKVKYGVNKIKLPLIFSSSGYYTLEITNQKGVKKYLTFQKA